MKGPALLGSQRLVAHRQGSPNQRPRHTVVDLDPINQEGLR